MLSFGLDMSMEVCHDILQDPVVKASYSWSLKAFRSVCWMENFVLKKKF